MVGERRGGTPVEPVGLARRRGFPQRLAATPAKSQIGGVRRARFRPRPRSSCWPQSRTTGRPRSSLLPIAATTGIPKSWVRSSRKSSADPREPVAEGLHERRAFRRDRGTRPWMTAVPPDRNRVAFDEFQEPTHDRRLLRFRGGETRAVGRRKAFSPPATGIAEETMRGGTCRSAQLRRARSSTRSPGCSRTASAGDDPRRRTHSIALASETGAPR